jgi:hypothetical protein
MSTILGEQPDNERGEDDTNDPVDAIRESVAALGSIEIGSRPPGRLLSDGKSICS